MRAFSELAIDSRLSRVIPDIAELADKEMTDSNLSLFASLACRECLAKTATLTAPMQAALYYSCSHLLGKVCSRQLLKKNMHRLIANWNFISDGQTIPEWRGEQITTDVSFLALETAEPGAGNGRLYNVRTKLKTGLCAGIILWISLYDGVIFRFLDKWSGCSRYNCAAEELAGMYARLTLTVEANVPKVQGWSTTDSQRKRNKEITDKRTEPGKCRRMIPCNTCQCTVSQCALAVWADSK